MAFPTTVDVLSVALAKAQSEAKALKQYLTDARAAMAAGSVSGNLVVEVHLRLIAARVVFDAVAAVPGIAQYAKDQFDDQAFNVVTEFTAMVNALVSARDWISTNAVTTGWLTFSTSGVTYKSFTSGQTAGLRTQLDAVIATIG